MSHLALDASAHNSLRRSLSFDYRDLAELALTVEQDSYLHRGGRYTVGPEPPVAKFDDERNILRRYPGRGRGHLEAGLSTEFGTASR